MPISNNQPGGGGFIVFPGASFSPDQSSNVAVAGGFQGLSYVRGIKRWVPAPRSAIRPDGKAYVYFQYQVGILLVDIASGGQRRLGPQPNGPASQARVEQGGWQILDAASEGVYAIPQGAGPQSSGLWLFPYDGPERQVIGSGYWQAMGGGAAWGTVSPSVPQGAANIILRHDLKSGTESAWFTQPATNARVAGFDADEHPVIQGFTPTASEIWVATASGAARRLAAVVKPAAQGMGEAFFVQSVVGDPHGLWVATSDGLYFAPPGAALTKVAPVTGFLAGGCS